MDVLVRLERKVLCLGELLDYLDMLFSDFFMGDL